MQRARFNKSETRRRGEVCGAAMAGTQLDAPGLWHCTWDIHEHAFCFPSYAFARFLDIIRRAGVLQSASEGARDYLLSDVCANTRDRGCCVPWCQVESNLLEAHPECIDKTNSGNARAT